MNEKRRNDLKDVLDHNGVNTNINNEVQRLVHDLEAAGFIKKAGAVARRWDEIMQTLYGRL